MTALRLQLTRTSAIAPTILVWALVIGFVVFMAATYLSDGMPSPYGVCYAGRGRPIPCELQKKNGPATNRRRPASLLPVATP